MCVGFKGKIVYYHKKLLLEALGSGMCLSCASFHCGDVQEYWTSAALSM